MPDLHARSVAQVVDPQAAVGVEEQMLRIGRPDVARHPVALAMIAVLLRDFPPAQCGDLGAAHQHVRLFRARIKIDQFAAIEVGEMLSVGRPGNPARRRAHHRAMTRRFLPPSAALRAPAPALQRAMKNNATNADRRQIRRTRQNGFLRADPVDEPESGWVAGRNPV